MNLLRWLATCCLAAAAPLAAQEPAQTISEPASSVVAIPFSPPLGQPLRYRVTRTISRASAQGPFWTDYEVTFSRRSAGYRMQVRVTDVGAQSVPSGQTSAFRRAMVEANPPFVLLLGEDAAVEDMEDAEAYWENSLRTIQHLIRQEGGAALDEVALEQLTAIMRDSSPEGRLNVLTQYIVPVIELAGAEFALGEQLELDAPIDGLMGLSMNQTIRLRAERVENGRLVVTSHASVPEADMRRATQEFLARIPVTGQGANTAAERERVAAQLADARYDRTMESQYEVSLATGLVVRFSSDERINIELGGETQRQVRTVLIERRD